MNKKNNEANNTIAFQGLPGAYSHLACQSAFPSMQTKPCASFEDAFNAVKTGLAIYAMIPIENSAMGRVADIHRLLPESGLSIVGEHFQRVRHHLLGIPGTKLANIKTVTSQLPALSQCRKFITNNNFNQAYTADTAGAAQELEKIKDNSLGAIASSLAAEIYKLEILASNIEDDDNNTTRFIIMSSKQIIPPITKKNNEIVTSFIFRVRNVPAALYKALGCFATNGVNITKLESYLVDGNFTAAQFYADVEGHQKDESVKFAIKELKSYSKEVKILGTYPAHKYRNTRESS